MRRGDFFMEKKLRLRLRDLPQKLWLFLLLQAVFFIAGVLLAAALIHREALPIDFDAPAVPVLAGAAAFCAAAVFSRFARQDLFLKGLLTQALFWTVMLLLGAALLGGETAWPRFFAALAVAAAGTAAAALLCGGGKRKKKFQKNAPIRLKRK